jgi:hypothetical protein
MKVHIATLTAIAAFACSGALDAAQAQSSDTQTQTTTGSEQHALALTPAQRRAIYAAVSQDKSKAAKTNFSPTIGAEVPPMIELYTLPDQILAENHAAESYEYTLEQNKVVLVDPTRMRVIDVIGPQQ